MSLGSLPGIVGLAAVPVMVTAVVGLVVYTLGREKRVRYHPHMTESEYKDSPWHQEEEREIDRIWARRPSGKLFRRARRALLGRLG